MSTETGTGTSVVCSVAPMLSVRHGSRAVEFYKAAFGDRASAESAEDPLLDACGEKEEPEREEEVEGDEPEEAERREREEYGSPEDSMRWARRQVTHPIWPAT